MDEIPFVFGVSSSFFGATPMAGLFHGQSDFQMDEQGPNEWTIHLKMGGISGPRGQSITSKCLMMIFGAFHPHGAKKNHRWMVYFEHPSCKSQMRTKMVLEYVPT